MEIAKNRKTGIIKHLICTIATAACAVFQHFALLYYIDVDNFKISMVLNGLYSSDNVCQYVSPILSPVVKLMTKIFPKADCFALLCWLFMMAAIYASFLFILEKIHGGIGKITGFLLVFFVIFNICEGIFCNYTIQTVIISTVGWIYLLTEVKMEKVRKNRVVFADTMLFFGMILRNKAACLMLPFAGLVIATELVGAKLRKEEVKPYLIKYLSFLAQEMFIIAVLVLIQYAVLYSPAYKESTKFDAARVAVLDYPSMPYGATNLAKTSDISENDYYAQMCWTLADTDVVTTDFLEKVADSGRYSGWSRTIVELQLGKGDLGVLLREIYYSVYTKIDKLMKVFLIFLLLETVTDPKLKTEKQFSIYIAFAGAGLILLFFSYTGRIPKRVSLSVLIGIILTRAALIDWKEKKESPVHMMAVLIMASLLLVLSLKLVIGAEYLPRGSFMNALEHHEKQTETEMPEGEDAIYIWSSANDEDLLDMESGKLFSKEKMKHNIPVGDWMSGQNYFKEYLKEIGVENPMKALLYRENTYYVQEDSFEQKNLILNWLREHYDENTQIEPVRRTAKYTVWRYYIEEEKAQLHPAKKRF